TAAHYSRISELRCDDTVASAANFADGSVDLLLIDDIDCGTQVRRELEGWQPKLSTRAIILLHGASLERADPPSAGWPAQCRHKIVLGDGIGLEIAVVDGITGFTPARALLFNAAETAAANCRLGVELMSARVRARRAQAQADAV